MNAKKIMLNLAFLPAFFTGLANVQVESYVKTEASGENTSVKSQVTAIVNDKVVNVESDQPGELKVEIKNGQVTIETSPEASPAVTISEANEPESKPPEPTHDSKKPKKKIIFSFFENIISRLRIFLNKFLTLDSRVKS